MATLYFTSPKTNDRLAQLWEDLRAEAVPFRPAATQGSTVGAAILLKQEAPLRRGWKADLSTWFQSVLQLEAAELPSPSAVAAISEGEAFSALSIEAAHEASLAISSPFHWEPKPAWIERPGNCTPAFLDPSDPRRFAARPKIPIRPLHKRPFYRRFFFYLSRWLSRPR